MSSGGDSVAHDREARASRRARRTMRSARPRTARALRFGSTGSAAAVVVALAIVLGLHVLRRDLEPASHRLSEYAVGPWGWLMTSAFVLVAVGVWLLRRALPASTLLRPVRALLALAVVGFAVSGLVPTDPATPDAVSETVHSAASAGALMASAAAAMWTVTIGVESIAWRRALGPARVVTAVAGLAVVMGPWVHDGPWTGAVQRLSVAALAVWLLLVSHAASTRG
jgi:hypothetical protein